MPRQMPVPPPVTSATWPASAPSRNTSRGLGIARIMPSARKNPKPTREAGVSRLEHRRRCCSCARRGRAAPPRAPRARALVTGGLSCVLELGAMGDVRPRHLDLCSCVAVADRGKKSLADCTSFDQKDKGDDTVELTIQQQLHGAGRLLDHAGAWSARRTRRSAAPCTPKPSKLTLLEASRADRRGLGRGLRRRRWTIDNRPVGLRAEQGLSDSARLPLRPAA